MQTRLAEVETTLAAALPASQRDLRRAALALTRGLHHVDGAATCSLHGDLHPRNLLVDGERVSLIDLDGLRHGPAVLEIGSWIADGAYRALLDGASAETSSAGWRALLEGYAAAGGARFDAAALAWATAWALLTQRAYRCVVNLKPGRFAIAPRLVTLAGAIAEGRMMEL
jgi:Ser/Thr protein kinase RdoA (MazF antagonist)